MLLVLLGQVAKWGLPRLLSFVNANGELIQGLASLLQLALWAGALLAFIVGIRRIVVERRPPLPTTHTPQQVPADIDDFVDREEELDRTKRYLKPRTAVEPVPVFVVAGAAGVGKTALAVKAAHQLKSGYPDGQLYAQLRTPEGGEVDAGEILSAFLRALSGEEIVIPTSLQERANTYRARLGERRILVFLDAAIREEQVRPLIPGSGTCAVLITSQQLLASLPGGRQKLPVLAPDHALELLGKVAGDHRVTGDPGKARQIVEDCGRLPLAVRICGAQLASDPESQLSSLADHLHAEHERLSTLRAGDLEVKASFALSYEARNPTERTVFRLLSLIKAPTFPGWVAAALLGDPGAQDADGRRARDALNGLVEAHLLESTVQDRIGQLRYRFHQLLYLFAAERLPEDEEPASQRLALQRLLVTYFDLAQQALERLQPGESGSTDAPARLTHSTTSVPDQILRKVQEDPLTWFTVERETLLGAILVANERKEWELCVLLAHAMVPYLELRALWDDWRQASDLALDAAIQSGDRSLLAQAKRDAGDLLRDQRQWKDAGELFVESLQLYGHLGEPRGEARTIQSIGNLYRDQGDWQEAIGWYEQCLSILESLGDRRGQASALYDISVAYRNDGDWEQAIAGFQECLKVFEELGDLRSQASTRRGIGVALRNRWQWPEAIDCFETALELFKKVGDRRGFARTLANRADVYQEQQQWKEGIADLKACLRIHEALGDVLMQADTLRRMSVLYRKKGEPRTALKLLNDPGCLPLLAGLDEHRWHHYAMLNLGEAFLGLKRLPEARELFEECLPYFQGRGKGRRDRLWEAKTLHGLGVVLAQGSPQEQTEAAKTFKASLAIFQDLGSPEAAEIEERLRRLPMT